MGRYERWNLLLELLARDGQLSVDDAARELAVSTATIRRDFEELARQQMLTRTRGGAVGNTVAYDLPLRYKTARHASEKERIGRAAAGMVGAGAVVGLNGGTTTTDVARALALRTDLNGSREAGKLTVVTNALNIANELAVRQHVKIVVTGGIPRAQSYELVGPLARLVLEEVSLDVAFIGVDGINTAVGATTHNEEEASVNQLIVQRAAKVVVVADSSKLGRQAFARICGLDELDGLITDRPDDMEEIQRLEEAGVTVTLV
ncbi:MAG TPA: DeoR/GlpR family DNA-binding transcription regulator [Solirubrobacteraceae bacterium]